ncbi:MAG TPA: aldehyde dehydrogenase family protein [Thermoplasmata archaeon]|nr:aldehyde dehydrogenase family protein [Thermoplasmata archaeon]
MAGSTPPTYDQFIGGAPVPAASGDRQTLLDPANNRPIAAVSVAGPDDARHAMEAAQAAYEASWWATDDGSRRGKVLYRLAQKIEERLEEFARLETLNVGKTLKESRGDIGFVVRTLEYAAGLADKVQGETIPVPGTRLDFTLREPLGVTVHIAPWNYPLLLSMRSVAPALAAGNAAVLKPASLTPLTALALGQLSKEALLPDGILNVVAGPGTAVGEALVADPRCRHVSFTGGGEAGRRIAEVAAHHVVPTTLELGGKGPVIVLPDADLDRAARGVAFGIFGNAGQMCWAGSRLLAHGAIAEALVGKVARIAEKYAIGPGTSDTAEMGPLVSRGHLDSVVAFIFEAKDAGAKVVAGGDRPVEPALSEGNFLRPTVLSEIPPGARILRDEVFGPVLAVSTFADPEEAVRLANATRFGLFASVWTKDLTSGLPIARRIEAGMVSLNEAPATFPQTPFTGFKESGLGFEQGIDSVRAYTRRKNVLINYGVPKPKG